jgi:hypothetical protein
MKKIYITIGALLIAATAFAARDNYVAYNNDLRAQVFRGGMYIGSVSKDPSGNTKNKIPYVLANTATIDFTSTTVGVLESSAITVTGALAGDRCVVSVPIAAGAQKAKFECYVSASNAVKVKFTPMDETMGQVALTSASPSTATATVSAGSICTCTPVGASATIAAAGCATGVSSTTLTLTGPNTVTTTMTYYCRAPVDPASGTFTVLVFGQG